MDCHCTPDDPHQPNAGLKTDAMPHTPYSSTMVMNHYATLVCASEEMLDAARHGNWQSVMRLEAACTVIVLRLRELDRKTILSTRQRRQRTRILQTLVANDAEICRICAQIPATTPLDQPLPHAGNTTLH